MYHFSKPSNGLLINQNKSQNLYIKTYNIRCLLQHTFSHCLHFPTSSSAPATVATSVFSTGAKCPPVPMCFPWPGQVPLTNFHGLLLLFCMFLIKCHLNWILDSLFKRATCTHAWSTFLCFIFLLSLFICLISVSSPPFSPI